VLALFRYLKAHCGAGAENAGRRRAWGEIGVCGTTFVGSRSLGSDFAWDKNTHFCKNEPEKLLKTNDRLPKMGQNEPKNEAEKLLKIHTCEKNKPKRTQTQNRLTY
jgi:hypothetical protein